MRPATHRGLDDGKQRDRTYVARFMDSPVGRLRLVGSDDGLTAIFFETSRPIALAVADESSAHPLLIETERQLREYFAGTRMSFDLPLDFRGTDFQRRVWTALLAIPYGETRTYGEIAKAIGNPSAMRAVGAANGQNPIPIIAPCHRVIGSNGKLTGFGGGLPAKAHLLSLESVGAMRG